MKTGVGDNPNLSLGTTLNNQGHAGEVMINPKEELLPKSNSDPGIRAQNREINIRRGIIIPNHINNGIKTRREYRLIP